MKIYLIINDGYYNYQESVIDKNGVHLMNKSMNKIKSKHNLEGLFVHYLVKELKDSEIYRKTFIRHQKISLNGGNCFEIILQPTTTDLIDYNW